MSSLQEAEFIVSQMKKKVKTRLVSCNEPGNIPEIDEEAMTWFAQENPEYM